MVFLFHRGGLIYFGLRRTPEKRGLPGFLQRVPGKKGGEGEIIKWVPKSFFLGGVFPRGPREHPPLFLEHLLGGSRIWGYNMTEQGGTTTGKRFATIGG